MQAKLKQLANNKTVVLSLVFGLIAATIVTISLAASPNASLEPESSSSRENVTVGNDANASNGQYVQFSSVEDGSTPSNPSQRGPTGSWPRAQDPNNPGTLLANTHTPAYTTAADVVTNGSESGLQSALNSASSGDVIQHDGSIDDMTLSGGSTSWASNVLIRPSIGRRADYTLNNLRLEADHVTIAGYKIGGAVRARSAQRSGYAWGELDQSSSMFVDANYTDSADLFLWEMVYTPNESWVGGGDLIQSRGVAAQLTRATFVGNYWAGPTRSVGSGAHNDTFQHFSISGGSITETLIADSILFAAGDKSIQGSGETNNVIRNSTIYEPGTSEQWMPYPSGSEQAYGYHAITGGWDNGGTIVDSTIVGTFGGRVTNMLNSTLYASNANQVDAATGVALASGNHTPELLPSSVTHAYLDSIWSE